MERIVITNISKKFNRGYSKDESALGRIISFVSGKEPQKSFWVLKDLSFSVARGEIVGIIGENGCGKSTLLRIIAGIYRKDLGTITTKGKIISLINLKEGFYPQVSMRDNIWFICSFFKMSKQDIRANLDAIISFSGLDDFIATKIYQFSEGMIQRLAFAIAVHCNPDILLLDEVFEVGDEKFKSASADKIISLAKEGVSVVVVSHSLDQIVKYCSRVVWIEKGRLFKYGNVQETVDEYKKECCRERSVVIEDDGILY